MTGNVTVTATFKLPPPSIAVAAPNRGEGWRIGTSQTICWTSVGITGDVKIQLSRNGGGTRTTLFKGTVNDGSRTWKVTKLAATRARIRICGLTSPLLCDTSNANFTIR